MPDEITQDQSVEENSTPEENPATEENSTQDNQEQDLNETKDVSEDTDLNPDDYQIEERAKPVIAQDDSDEEDDGIDPDDKARISKVVEKRLSPIEERLQKQQDEIEVNEFILKNPEMSKYKPVILKYMASSAYKAVPVKGIAAIVAASDMQKIGAAKEREAQRKVKETQHGGSASRSSATTKFNPATASFSEMEKEIARVKGQVI